MVVAVHAERWHPEHFVVFGLQGGSVRRPSFLERAFVYIGREVGARNQNLKIVGSVKGDKGQVPVEARTRYKRALPSALIPPPPSRAQSLRPVTFIRPEGVTLFSKNWTAFVSSRR